MKRLVSAAIVAVGVHSLLMGMNVGWMKDTDLEKPPSASVTIVLESIQPLTIKPPNDPLPTKRYPRKVKRDVAEPTSESEVPLPPRAKRKPIETSKKTEIKAPIAESAPAQQVRPAEPNKPASQDQALLTSPETLPDQSSQEAEVPLPPPKEETTAFGTAPAAVSSQPAPPAILEKALPEYSKNPPISYPRRARKRGYEGTVVLEVLVDRNGKVDDLRILASSGYGILDRSAVKSVKTWSFKPAKKGSGTVDMWIQVPIRYNLE